MQFFAYDYNATADRLERVSPKFDDYSAAKAWNALNGRKNVDGDLTSLVGNDHSPETDYPPAESIVEPVSVFDTTAHVDEIDALESVNTDLRCEIDSLRESETVDDCLTFLVHIQENAALLRDNARALAITLNALKKTL